MCQNLKQKKLLVWFLQTPEASNFCVFEKMEKVEYRSVIKFLHKKGKNNAEIKAELDEVYGEYAPSLATVKFWKAEFVRGRTSVLDEPSTGRPMEVTTPEMINKVHDMIMADRRIKLREIAEALNISCERVWNIVHQHLEMKKLSARWVPRLLTIDQKRQRVTTSQKLLEQIQHDRKDFFRRFVTVDETWVHHYTPETKEQSKQWRKSGEGPPKKAKTTRSAGKVMATVFWDAKGIIHVDYLEKGKTITGAYYAALLDRFDAELRQKRPGLARKKVLFHQDNAPAHKSAVAMAKLDELGYELVDHPPYSPDLAACDFFLFPNLKKWLGGRRFASNDEVIAETSHYFEELEKTYYSDGIKKLEKRLTKCIELKGDYVEK